MTTARSVATASLFAVVALSLVVVGCVAGDDRPVATAPTSAPTTAAPGTAPSTTVEPGPTQFDIASADGSLLDAERGRTVPYRIHAPIGPAGAVPVILVSHGGSGSASGYERGQHLGTTFARGGFIAVHVGHLPSAPGSSQLEDRPADVSAVLDGLAEGSLAVPDGVVGVPDVDRAGHIGHSFGAYTAHALAGATYQQVRRDERIDAIVALSPQGAGQFRAFDDGGGDDTWSTVAVPAFALVGAREMDTNVSGSIRETGWRSTPFRRYPGTRDTFQAVLSGQDHSDLWSTGSDEVERYIAGESLEFFDVYVAGAGPDACDVGVGDLEGVELDRRPGSSGSAISRDGPGCPPLPGD